MQKPNIRNTTPDQLAQFIRSVQEKPFRTKQIQEWLWKKNVQSFDEMSNLSKTLIEKLKQQYGFETTTIFKEAISEDKTIKMVFRLFDGTLIEGVLIPSGNRVTACISSQVGCPLKCDFCATGKMGFTRNLHF